MSGRDVEDIQLFEHDYGLIALVRRFSLGRSPRLFPEGGVAYNRVQRVGYPACTAVIQLQPAAHEIF